MQNHKAPQVLSWCGRLVALLLVAHVFTIGILAASPHLHKAIHPDADKPSHVCGIVVFAHGATTPVTTVAVAPHTEIVWSEILPVASQTLLLTPPKYLLPLQCGPPASV